MNNWDREEHNFGTVPKGSKLKTVFTYLGTKKIKEMETYCNCVSYLLTGNTLHVEWKVKPDYKKPTDSQKVIAIIYEDDSLDDLTLKAHIRI